MATAKPKTKRMMLGGVSRSAAPAGAKPGMGPKPGFREPSLNSMKRAIKTVQSGKTVAGPMGSQLQSAAKSILAPSTVGSQRALPANPMKKGGAVKKRAFKK